MMLHGATCSRCLLIKLVYHSTKRPCLCKSLTNILLQRDDSQYFILIAPGAL